jgi:cytochrome c oxidase cbb3-type subunit 1
MLTTAPTESPRHEHLVEERLVFWYFCAALGYMLISMLAGIVMGLQLLSWNPLPSLEVLSPGRWRMVHTNAIAYGFLANAFLGMMHWVVPRLTLRPVLEQSAVVLHLRRVADRRVVDCRWPPAG